MSVPSDPDNCDSSSGFAAPTSNPTEQLVRLAKLTGGLAHEIRNPLSTLRMNLQLLDEDWRRLEASQEADERDVRDVARRSRRRVATLLTESTRLETILEDFLQFVHRRELNVGRHDINEIIAALAEFYRPQAEIHGVELDVRLHPEPLTCPVDANMLKQAMLNLLINAQQAMPDRGLLTVEARTEGPDKAAIDITDTGSGIPPDRHQTIFDAYYSTKKAGSGLGLAVAKQIIEQHGGEIRVTSRPPHGAKFTVVLPRDHN